MGQKKNTSDKWNKQEADKRSNVPLTNTVVQNRAMMIPLLDTVTAGVTVAGPRSAGVMAYLAAAEPIVDWLLVNRIAVEASLVIRAEVKAFVSVIRVVLYVDRDKDAWVAALDQKLKQNGPQAEKYH